MLAVSRCELHRCGACHYLETRCLGGKRLKLEMCNRLRQAQRVEPRRPTLMRDAEF